MPFLKFDSQTKTVTNDTLFLWNVSILYDIYTNHL